MICFNGNFILHDTAIENRSLQKQQQVNLSRRPFKLGDKHQNQNDNPD